MGTIGAIQMIFDRFARPVRDLVRWAARWLALVLVFPATGRSQGRLDQAVGWLASAPAWAPLLLLLPAVLLLRRAVWAGLGEYLADGGQHATLAEQRPLRLDAWRGRAFPAVQLALTVRALAVCALAAASGWASVLVAREVLQRDGGLTGYATAAAAGVLLSWAEALPFLPWIPRRPPARDEVKARLGEYLTWFPQEAGKASALLFAYSRLDRRAVTAWVARFTPAPRAVHLAGLLLTALLFTLAPAPSVDELTGGDRLAAGYAVGVGCFTVAGWLTAAWVVVLLAVSPLPVLWALVRFGLLWRMPPSAIGEVLRRERGPARRSVVSAAWRAPVWAVAGAAALWLSAIVGARTGSGVAGLVALVAAGLLAAYPAYQLTRHRP